MLGRPRRPIPQGGGVPGRGARLMLQAAKRAGAAAIGDAAASEGLVPDRDDNTPEPNGPPGPDWRRLLDGYAEPGRVAGSRTASDASRPLGVAGGGSGSGVF